MKQRLKKYNRKVNETMFFEKINKINNPSARLIKTKEWWLQKIKIKWKERHIKQHTNKKDLRDYEVLYDNKWTT